MNNLPRKFVQVIGDGKAQVFTVDHGLHTKDVVVMCYGDKTGDCLNHTMSITVTTLDQVEIDTSSTWYYDPDASSLAEGTGWTPGVDSIRVVIMG